MKKIYDPNDLSNFPRMKRSFRGTRHIKSSYTDAYIRKMKKQVAPPKLVGIGTRAKRGLV